MDGELRYRLPSPPVAPSLPGSSSSAVSRTSSSCPSGRTHPPTPASEHYAKSAPHCIPSRATRPAGTTAAHPAPPRPPPHGPGDCRFPESSAACRSMRIHAPPRIQEAHTKTHPLCITCPPRRTVCLHGHDRRITDGSEPRRQRGRRFEVLLDDARLALSRRYRRRLNRARRQG